MQLLEHRGALPDGPEEFEWSGDRIWGGVWRSHADVRIKLNQAGQNK